MTSRYAIIVAGGSGSRMNSEIPKQFLELDGKPILMRTIEQFTNDYTEIIVVLPENQIEFWNKLVLKYEFNHPITVVKGGKTRFDSVKNGLRFINNDKGIVAIHDGVRPFISKKLIEKLYSEAQENGNAIPYTMPKESIRIIENNTSKSVNRSLFRFIQTPQCFDLKKLKKAYSVENKDTFTDDASVFENDNNEIHLVEGEYSNIKITTPEDLV